MLTALPTAAKMLDAAIDVLNKQDDVLLLALDSLPAPIYVTDSDGIITYFNPACVHFAGRTPTVGKDRWCVTWKLYTNNGDFLPHDQCPMADAIRAKRPIRGVIAVAERPDGTRVTFMPYPTPLWTKDSDFLGAVNMLIDVTEQRQADELRAEAARCRRLASGIGDRPTQEALTRMAIDYEAKAAQLILDTPS